MPAGPPLSRPARFFCSPAINVRVKRNFSTRKSGAAMPPWGSGLWKEKRGRERASAPAIERRAGECARAPTSASHLSPSAAAERDDWGPPLIVRVQLNLCTAIFVRRRASLPRPAPSSVGPLLRQSVRPSVRSSESETLDAARPPDADVDTGTNGRTKGRRERTDPESAPLSPTKSRVCASQRVKSAPMVNLVILSDLDFRHRAFVKRQEDKSQTSAALKGIVSFQQ